MSKQFTSGPWRISENGTDIYIRPTTVEVGDICFVIDDFGKQQQRTNAQLISAAPDMYEALKSLIFTASKLWDEVKPIKDTNAMTVTHPIIEEARVALAKAEGGTPNE